jgi:outer membrane protein assembly factor BamA
MRLLLFGFMLFGAALFGQSAPQGPQTAYEGQNVSAVSLIANPHRDLKPLVPLVTQKAGEHYSDTKIRASADALKQAGNFPQVRVNGVFRDVLPLIFQPQLAK